MLSGMSPWTTTLQRLHAEDDMYALKTILIVDNF